MAQHLDADFAEAVVGVVAEHLADWLASDPDAAAERLVDQTQFQSLQVRNGKIELELAPAHEIVVGWVMAARTMLQDAPNYSETSMEFGDRETGERFAFTVQRVGKQTLRVRPSAFRAAGRTPTFQLEAVSCAVRPALSA